MNLKKGFKVRNNMVTNTPIQSVYNYNDEKQKMEFMEPDFVEIKVPQNTKTVAYDTVPKLAIAHSQIGASKAIQLGAYVFALENLW